MSSRLPHLLFLGGGLLVSCACAALGMLYSHMLDWTMLGMALVCLMPGLMALDLLTMLALVWSWRENPASREGRDFRLAGLASLAILHLATAGLSVLLLAVPAGSLWSAGITLPRLRASLLALATLSFYLSLELPYLAVGALVSLLRRKNGAEK